MMVPLLAAVSAWAAQVVAEMPDLAAAIVSYDKIVAQAQAEQGPNMVGMATTRVCSVAYRYTIVRQDLKAADVIAAYNGRNADLLKASCSLYFEERAH